ncbi:hypothetical protein KKA72_02790, partial [Patescibacteria group bacterium]|nr:hypothetical protein [Patescibacteria group bacterium]
MIKNKKTLTVIIFFLFLFLFLPFAANGSYYCDFGGCAPDPIIMECTRLTCVNGDTCYYTPDGCVPPSYNTCVYSNEDPDKPSSEECYDVVCSDNGWDQISNNANCPSGEICNSSGFCELADPNPNPNPNPTPSTGFCNASIIPCGTTGTPTCQFCHIFVLLNNIITYTLTCLTPIAGVLMIVIGGFILLTAGNNRKRFEEAKKIITATVIGIVIILTAWLLLNTFLTAIGVANWTGLGSWWRIECVSLPEYYLTLAANDFGGTTNPTPGIYQYQENNEVQMTAYPLSGYSFEYWELDGVNQGSDNPITFLMDKDYILKANFKVSDAKLACDSTCIDKYGSTSFGTCSPGNICLPGKVSVGQDGCSSGACCCLEVIQTCSDGTPYSSCLPTKPLYCSGGTLISNCSLCGCSSGTCQSDGTCKTTTTTTCNSA